MAHGPMEKDDAQEYLEYLNSLKEQIVLGAQLIDDNDKLYLLDKVEESRWKTGVHYNRGVHILMDVIQLLVEAAHASPNKRL